ncbi:MAG: hypothetical protein VX921_02675 [Chloroflexota bacterium]|nr:hypothetical protein [Chloroflexota bacterium]
MTQDKATGKVKFVSTAGVLQRLLKNVQLIGKSECVQDGFMLKYYRSSSIATIIRSCYRISRFGDHTETTTSHGNFQPNGLFLNEP